MTADQEDIQILPPHNREAEEAAIGAILVDPGFFPEVAQIIKSSDFYIHRNGWIWETFEKLIAKHEPIDIVTVGNDLRSNGKLDEVGGPAHLTQLSNILSLSYNVEAYARMIKDCSQRRQAIALANEIAKDAYKVERDFDLSSYVPNILHGEKLDTRRNLMGTMEQIYSDLFEDKSSMMTFGVSDLDERLGGLFRKELTILAGDQGTGKSALMTWIARANAKRKLNVTCVSLEMSAESFLMRMACGDLGVNWNQVRANKVDEETRLEVWGKVQELAETYKDHLTIYEDPMTLQSIQAAVMREHSDIVFIDHAFLVTGLKETRNGTDKIDQLNGVQRFLRQNIAKPFNCHVVLLWQLNRSAFKENRKPTKHDLYMAGTQDPDSILLLYRPDLYDQDAQKTPPTRPVDLDVIIGKARNDYTGEVSLKYDLSKQAFGGLAREHPHQS